MPKTEIQRIIVLLALTIAFMIGALAPAVAAPFYMLERVTYQPYGVTIIAGPFYTLTDCLSVESGLPFVAGGSYECALVYG